jgi:hypothetical protein
MTRFNIHGLGFTLFLALLTALPALSIDMALPSLSLIQAEFHAPQTESPSSSQASRARRSWSVRLRTGSGARRS